MVMSDQEVRAVLFDMSGTLYPQTHVARAAASSSAFVRDMFGIEQPVEHIMQTIRTCWISATPQFVALPFYLMADLYREFHRRAFNDLGVSCSDDQLELVIEDLRQAAAREASPQEGATELLNSLRNAGIRTGIVSVNDERDLSLLVDSCGFRDHVDFILSSEAARSCKPDREIFLQALHLADVPAAQAVYVGDMPALDVLGANRVGMRSVLLTQEAGFMVQPSIDEGAERPDFAISHLDEFGPIVLGRQLP